MKGENTEYFFNTPESTVPEDQISRRHAVSRETGGTNVDHCSNQSRSATPKTPLSSLFLSVLNGNNTENLYKNEGGALYDALTKGCTSDSRDTLECPSQPRNLRMTAYSDFDSLVQDPTGVHDQYHSESCFSPKQDQSMYGYYYGHHNTHVGMPTNTVNLNVMQNEQFSRKETTNKHFYNIPNAAKTIVPSSHPQASHQMTMKKSSLPIIGSKQLSCFVPGDSSNISGASQSAAVFSREQNPSEYAVAYPGAINTEWKCSRQTGGSHEPTLDIRQQQQQKAPFSSHPFRSPYTTVQDSGSLTKVNVNSSVCFDGEKTFTDLSNSRTNQPLTLHQRQLNPFHDFNSELTHTQVQNQIELRNSQNAPLKPFPPWSREEFDCTPNVTVVSDGKGGQSQFQFHSRWSKVKTDSEKIFENHLKKFQHLTSSQERKPRREKSFDSVLNGNNGDRESNSKKLEVARKNDKICEEDSKDSADEERASVFSCKWLGCDASYSDRNDLVRHIEKVHIDQRKADDLYICYWECCTRQTKPFNARYKLVIHMRVHSGEKPNKCTFPGCTKAFSRLENLKIHMRSHTGEKPYMCQFPSCPKAFSNSSDRAKHQRTHLDTKPYACQVPGCPKRYTDPSSLRKHFKQHLTGKVQQSTNNKAKQKPKANKMSKRDLLGEGVTRPMDYRQKVLESLQHGVNDSSVPPQHVPPEYMTSPWYNPENVAFYPFAQDVQFPMAEASTPEPSENTNGTFTQTLSSMEIPTFEEQLKPVTAAF